MAGPPIYSTHSWQSTGAARGRRWRRRAGWLLFLVLVLGMLHVEARTSYLQALLLPDYAQSLRFEVKEGPSDAIRFPRWGPFDLRMGYVRLPAMLERLQQNDFVIDRQARMSPEMIRYVDAGLYAAFREKTRAGLIINDHQDRTQYDFRYPRQAFNSFADIPPVVADTLLFVEDRKLLDPQSPRKNPAVNWGRFLKATLAKVGDSMNIDTPSMGGSTLATQIEKYRHSEDGITGSIGEKLRQMASASVRVYQQGADTMPARRRLVLDYLNTVPLSAAPGHGEVNGIGDGLQVWFAADLDEVKAALLSKPIGAEELELQGRALRQVVALIVAQRRPSYYLVQRRDQLEELVDAHLRLLRSKELIGQELLQAALETRLQFRDFARNRAVRPVDSGKGVNMVRSRLMSLLGVPLYDLDRLDLVAQTTLDGPLQQEVTQFLRDLGDPETARRSGLVGEYLLKPGQTADLRYSFTLFERTPHGSMVRVQTDNTDMPFDINEGSKLELGSTAKVRVLVSYLGVIAEMHEDVAGKPDFIRAQLRDPDLDRLGRWVLERHRDDPDISLQELLAEAMERRHSAHPGEVFITGGGAHTFGNFKREDNNRLPTVRESLRESINLPFVRMLREVISHITYQQWSDLQAVRKDDDDPRRRQMLDRFIERESILFLSRFWSKYADKSDEERLETFLSGLKPTPGRLAVIHRYLFPDADFDTFAAFLQARLPQGAPGRKAMEKMYGQYGPDRYNLHDQGYLARVHPLELWLLGYLGREHAPGLGAAIRASTTERREVYNWLMRTKAKNARDNRIRTMLEVEAFSELHRRWRQLGYPFEHLVPSLATALGSSGDRPVALAELVGIILNNGERQPAVRVTELAFGRDTPFETRLSRSPVRAEAVMHPAVADTMRQALADVVNNGTARRLQGQYVDAAGRVLEMGGKTGTGDNRLVLGSGGQKVKSRALSRTATLVFFLGDRHFGTLTAFVPGDAARNYRFTSALPTQVLKSMAPVLQPYLLEAETRWQQETAMATRVEATDATLTPAPPAGPAAPAGASPADAPAAQ